MPRALSQGKDLPKTFWGSSQCRAAIPCPPSERLCSCEDFRFPLLWLWLLLGQKSHSSQVFSTGPLEWAARPSLAVSIKQFFEVWLLGSVRPPCAAPSSCSAAKLGTLGSRAWSPWQLQLNKKPITPLCLTTSCPLLKQSPQSYHFRSYSFSLPLIPSQGGPAQMM